MGTAVTFFFSGFVMGRVPFGLSPRFRPMLQRGVDLASLDVSYFTGLSYYILLLFASRGPFSLVFREDTLDDAEVMRRQMGMGMAPGAGGWRRGRGRVGAGWVGMAPGDWRHGRGRGVGGRGAVVLGALGELGWGAQALGQGRRARAAAAVGVGVGMETGFGPGFGSRARARAVRGAAVWGAAGLGGAGPREARR